MKAILLFIAVFVLFLGSLAKKVKKSKTSRDVWDSSNHNACKKACTILNGSPVHSAEGYKCCTDGELGDFYSTNICNKNQYSAVNC